MVCCGAPIRFIAGTARAATFNNAADNLPVHRIGRPEKIASMGFQIMENGVETGSVIGVDGGALVR